jgi:hypothetical protein
VYRAADVTLKEQMRVTISHTKGREEASRIVEDTVDNLLKTDLPGPFQMAPMNKQWNGANLNFTTAVAMGPLRLPVRGNIAVSDTEVAIEVDLPPLLGRFIPEQKLKEAVEKRVRGQLAS